MTTFNYLSFSSKQGLLVGNGGPWDCSGFNGSCTQSSENDAYGPITSTSIPSSLDGKPLYQSMTLGATISLADDEFMGATSIPFTLSFLVQATAQRDTTDTIGLRSVVGGVAQVLSSPHFNSPNPVSAIYSRKLGSRPSQIAISIELGGPGFSDTTVTATISNLNFVIHDVVYGGTSVAGSLPLPAMSPPPSSSTSSSDSVSTSSTNNGASLSRSLSPSTTISRYQTTVGSILQLSSNPGFQSYLPSPTSSPMGTSMTVSERAGVIAGSLIGVGLVLLTVAFWYQYRHRRGSSSGVGDGQSETDADSRMANQEPWIPRPYRKRPYSPTTENETPIPVEDERAEPWVPRPYRKRPYSRPNTENARILPVNDERARTIDLRGQGGLTPPRQIHPSRPMPPAYSQLTPRPA